MTDESRNPTNSAEGDSGMAAKLALVPADFPRQDIAGAVSGASAKLLLVQYEGKYYAPGSTPPEIVTRWEVCEDLVKHLTHKSLESKAGKRSHMTEEAILDQYLSRLIATNWVSEAEARWVIRRVAAVLHWPVPPAAME